MPSGKSAKAKGVQAVPETERLLAEKAKERAGGNAQLAALDFIQSSEATTSRWGRTRRIPRRLRARLQEYVDAPGGETSRPGAPAVSSELDTLANLPAVTQFLEVVHADVSLDPFAGLPTGYGERYREQLAAAEQDLQAYAEQLVRGLDAVKKKLLAEARLPKSKR